MAIQFQCSTCANPFHAPDHMAGTQARCNRCGAVVTVPFATTLLPSSQPSLSPYHAPFGTPQASEGIPKIVWVLIAGGAAVLMAAIAISILVHSFTGSSSNQHSLTSSPVPSPAAPTASAARQFPVASPNPRPPQAASQPAGFSLSPESPNKKSAPSETTASTSPGAGVKPSAAPPTATQSLPSEPPGSPAWSAGSGEGEQRIPIERETVTFGPSGCPVVVSWTKVWEIKSGRLLQELEGEYRRHGTKKTAISANGRWFAALLDVDDSQNPSIGVWDTSTGKQTCTVSPGADYLVDIMLFSLDKYLLVGGRKASDLQIWEAETGRSLKAIPTPCDRIDQGNIAFTADAKYYASVAKDRLVVIATQSKKTVAVMESPKAMERGPGQAVIVKNNRVEADSRTASHDAVFVFAWLQAMQFSSDSQELAAVSTHPRPRLMCWNNRGKLVYDEPLDHLPRMAFWEHTIQWLPDRSGWLVSGNIIDRETKRVVFGVRNKFGHDLNVYAIDKDRLLGSFPHNPGTLEVMQVPWDQIRASLKLLEEGAPALLGPSTPVSANVQLDNLRGDQAETLQSLGDAMRARLARDGLQIAPNCPTYFQLRFSEQAGDQLPIYSRQSPFDFRGQDTGRTATEAKGALVVELISEGTVLWRDTLQATSASSFREEITDATIRKSMLENLSYQISELNFPYFIPKSPDHAALPVVVQ